MKMIQTPMVQLLTRNTLEKLGKLYLDVKTYKKGELAPYTTLWFLLGEKP